jgi:predicted dithiol-disulfide oxidoreductase (DUF899 family)
LREEKETIMTATQSTHKIVSKEEWVEARKSLLAAEKAFTRERDELSRRRRELPWEKVEKNYVFDTPNGPRTLAQLFENRSQLIVYHFMFAPTWEEGCKSCSYLADHFDGMLPHLAHRDVTFTAISHAPLERLQAFQKRMGWRFPWASSYKNDFNHDYHVSFTKEEVAAGKVDYNYGTQGYGIEELPGLSVFYKDAAGNIFHTYSTYARGLDALVGTYQFLDLVPKGRDEEGLAFSMSWVRHHDRYVDTDRVDAAALYQPPAEKP